MPSIQTILTTTLLALFTTQATAGSVHTSFYHARRQNHLHSRLHHRNPEALPAGAPEPVPSAAEEQVPFYNGTSIPHLAPRGVYQIRDTFDHTNFFSSFNFFTGADPTHGFVDYLSYGDAAARGMANVVGSQIKLGVDASTMNPGAGRGSTRVSSNNAYTHGLFIADIAHMPSSTCGLWPAFWTFGPNWPNLGEIDIIEGVNNAATDTITLHTSAGCEVTNYNSLPGTTTTSTNCNAGNGNQGCSATTSNSQNYGSGFNANGGGVYAMQWESSGIYVWFFPRNAIPGDISSNQPDTTLWGAPLVAFRDAGCNFNAHFMNHNIIFDTTFCGDWAGVVWGQQCGNLGGSCQGYVAGNPGAFSEGFWLINSVKVYQL